MPKGIQPVSGGVRLGAHICPLPKFLLFPWIVPDSKGQALKDRQDTIRNLNRGTKT